ncbi:hypothetical protein [Burkholderia ubonensis]|uniref:hypothetical protein n=1 Tax=Burkholderia ubonensis TaxID=101571 RepID=UPI000AE675A3|nr:hypothetical protein [Burkholderia ubonensis]
MSGTEPQYISDSSPFNSLLMVDQGKNRRLIPKELTGSLFYPVNHHRRTLSKFGGGIWNFDDLRYHIHDRIRCINFHTGGVMASLEMQGPYDLSKEEIDKQITKTSAGNYALGSITGGKFIVMYVGRSDSDLNSRLKQHVDKHPKFKYSYASSPKAAFEKECKNFHDFGETEIFGNSIHPDRPADSEWKCPSCDTFD